MKTVSNVCYVIHCNSGCDEPILGQKIVGPADLQKVFNSENLFIYCNLQIDLSHR